ncbi:MAG TPA: hypothetical protein VIY73_10775 [Polyangiaceae bacterium]
MSTSDAGALTDGPPSSCGDLQATGNAPPLRAEAGFVDVPAQPTAATYAARMFYDFQPADTQPEAKPLFLFFNGGPGWATSIQLMVRGTGRVTLPPIDMAVQSIRHVTAVPNPASWTRFGNLLYIDERLTGFSYATSPPTPCFMSSPEDASDFVRVLLHFLDGHPALTASRVILVGESYGGVRASWMLDLLLRYPNEASRGGPDLPGLIQSHYDAAFGCPAGTVVDEATAAKQFGAQVLVEPYISAEQVVQEALLRPSDPYVGSSLDPCAVDTEDALEPPNWTNAGWAQAMAALSDPDVASSLLGVDPRTIPDLQPAARGDAFKHVPGPAPAIDAGTSVLAMPDGGPVPQEPFCPTYPLYPVQDAVAAMNMALTSLLGPLAKSDAYYAQPNLQYSIGAPVIDQDVTQPFVANLRYVRTFITNARYDLAIYAPSIPAAISAEGFGGTVDDAPRPGVTRPGWFTVNLPAASGLPAQAVEVRFPLYDKSGHAVAASQPAELATDVQAWLQGN